MTYKTIAKSSEVLKILSGIFLIFASAQITIPLHPVPITLQTLAVMLIGLTYSMSSGLAAIISYVILGSLGLPVFAHMSHGLSSPSSGYLIGFIAAVYVMNKFKQRFGISSILSIVSASILGSIVIFSFGIAYLSTFIGFSGAIQHGFIPFIIPGLVKFCLLAIILRIIKFKRI